MASKKNRTKKKNKNPKANKVQVKKPVRPTLDKWAWISLVAIILLTAFSYSNSLNGELTNWDDEEYVLMNTNIQKLEKENLDLIFSQDMQGNYHPLTMLSLALDYQPLKDENGNTVMEPRKGYPLVDPVPFHLTNLILHILAAILLFFFIFYLLSGNWLAAAIVSLLFAIHPMHVESVAWVTARKDVLYAFFFFAGLWSYLGYVRKKNYLLLLLSFTLFAASCLSKPAAVVFPLILFLIDYWEGRNFEMKAVLEKIPFLITSVIIGRLTVKYQGVEAIGDWDRFSLWERIMYAGHSFMGYIVKFFYPVPLKIFYPYPTFGNPPIETQIAPFAALAIVGAAIYFGRKQKALLFGTFFYLLTVALVLQFVSVGGAVMAERYTYLPYIGLSFILAYYISQAFNSTQYKTLGLGALIVVLVGSLAFATITFKRTEVWQNADNLYTSILETHPKLHGMRLNRGNYYLGTEQYGKALEDYKRAIKIKPNNSDPYFNIALIHNYNERYARAVEVLDTAISVNKSDYSLFSARANNLRLLGKNKRALKDYNRAIALYNSDPMTYLNRGICYFAFSDWDNAYSDFSKAASIQPRLPDAYNNMGFVHSQKGENEEAMKMFQKTLALNPNHPNALINVSQIHFNSGNIEKAIEFAQKAQTAGAKINPEYLKQIGI